MSYFAQIVNSIVCEVIVVSDGDCGGGNFPESEVIGQAFIAAIGLPGEWKQTSYNGNFRGTYAGVGYSYDSENDVFVAPVVDEITAITP